MLNKCSPLKTSRYFAIIALFGALFVPSTIQCLDIDVVIFNNTAGPREIIKKEFKIVDPNATILDLKELLYNEVEGLGFNLLQILVPGGETCLRDDVALKDITNSLIVINDIGLCWDNGITIQYAGSKSDGFLSFPVTGEYTVECLIKALKTLLGDYVADLYQFGSNEPLAHNTLLTNKARLRINNPFASDVQIPDLCEAQWKGEKLLQKAHLHYSHALKSLEQRANNSDKLLQDMDAYKLYEKALKALLQAEDYYEHLTDLDQAFMLDFYEIVIDRVARMHKHIQKEYRYDKEVPVKVRNVVAEGKRTGTIVDSVDVTDLVKQKARVAIEQYLKQAPPKDPRENKAIKKS